MITSALLPRPWSGHRPKVSGYEPQITGEIQRVSRSKRNAWRATVLVDKCPMATSHHNTKTAAESHCAKMMEAYTEVHYFSA
jgi:hypothetical protein